MAYRSRWSGVNRQHEVGHIVLLDQHGRPWEATWDKKGMGTCSPLEPSYRTEGFDKRRWEAPVMPPPDCLQQHENKPQQVTILYEKWIAAWQDAANTYEELLRTWSQAMRLSVDHPEVIRTAGPAPKPVEVVRAAQAGNKWALGLVPFSKLPMWAEKYRAQLTPLSREAYLAKAAQLYPDLDEEVEALRVADAEANAKADAEHEAKIEAVILKRKPGRPPKAKVEAVDAYPDVAEAVA